LPLLLVLTAGDYALWAWSIAEGHDVVSLVAGLTLLPSAAACLAMLAVGAARLLGMALERPSARAGERERAVAKPASVPSSPESAKDERASRRLAA
jgi:hypothetical protein